MKKIELLAELAKAKRIMDTTEYYTLDHSNAFREVKHAKEEELKKNFENDQKLLRKVDIINNALFESDAKEYVEVLGNHLSVATARKYLDEFEEDICMDRRRDEIDDIREGEIISAGANMRAIMYNKCTVTWMDVVDKDPLNLKYRSAEFYKKMLDWYYGLKIAVSISDATTEIDCPY